MLMRTALIAGVLGLGILSSPAMAEDIPVDLELVLAVDVSRSMTKREQEIQRRGYAEALVSEEVISAIRSGGYGSIALTYVEWAGALLQNIVVPWTRISSREDAQAFVQELSVNIPYSLRRTSISGAIDYSASLFERNGFAGLRRVIDISGDGPNNDGGHVARARDNAVIRGVIINGLPLMTREGMGMQWQLDDLDVYYRECVIGGTGSFVIPVLDWEDFPKAVRRKLVLEISGITTLPDKAKPGVRPIPVAGGYDCLVGEKIWRDLFDDRF
ncbi:MAG: DUF1194 domain-containing protein [Rhodobiaceae bacterium]|nr:DUF1194 domain-containing protein [Rhodobiaceae bacterium]MCC0047596.1 DUF1194 domain-containing protein [Rhodobiaceae bacterium]